MDRSSRDVEHGLDGVGGYLHGPLGGVVGERSVLERAAREREPKTQGSGEQRSWPWVALDTWASRAPLRRAAAAVLATSWAGAARS